MKILKENKNDSYLALISAIQEQVKIIKSQEKVTANQGNSSYLKDQKNAS